MPGHRRGARDRTSGTHRAAQGRRALLTGVLAMAVTGCAPGGSGGPGGGPEPPPSPSATPSESGPARPGRLLLNWLTTGGLAGVHRQTLLYADGTYTVSEEGGPSRTGHIPAEDAARVRELLEQAALGRQPRRSTGPGADLFHHRIAYDGHVVYRDDSTLGEPLRSVAALVPVR